MEGWGRSLVFGHLKQEEALTEAKDPKLIAADYNLRYFEKKVKRVLWERPGTGNMLLDFYVLECIVFNSLHLEIINQLEGGQNNVFFPDSRTSDEKGSCSSILTNNLKKRWEETLANSCRTENRVLGGAILFMSVPFFQ